MIFSKVKNIMANYIKCQVWLCFQKYSILVLIYFINSTLQEEQWASSNIHSYIGNSDSSSPEVRVNAVPRLPIWNRAYGNEQRQIDFTQLFELMGEPRGNRGRQLSELISRPRPKCNRRIRILNGVTRIKERGSLARFVCSHGFTLIGPTTLVCLRDRWSEDPPICVKSGCRPLKTPENADMRQSIGGAVAAFYCNPGTELLGNAVIFCDGYKWNGTEPTCFSNDSTTETVRTTTFYTHNQDQSEFQEHDQIPDTTTENNASTELDLTTDITVTSFNDFSYNSGAVILENETLYVTTTTLPDTDLLASVTSIKSLSREIASHITTAIPASTQGESHVSPTLIIPQSTMDIFSESTAFTESTTKESTFTAVNISKAIKTTIIPAYPTRRYFPRRPRTQRPRIKPTRRPLKRRTTTRSARRTLFPTRRRIIIKPTKRTTTTTTQAPFVVPVMTSQSVQDYVIAIDKEFPPSREHVAPIRPIEIIPGMLNINASESGSQNTRLSAPSTLGGIIIFVIGLSTFFSGIVLYYWRKNKGIARARPHDIDGRALSLHDTDANDDFMWLDHTQRANTAL